MFVNGRYPRNDWETVGIEKLANAIHEHKSRGIRVFMIDRFENYSTAAVVAELQRQDGVDNYDGIIDNRIQEMLTAVTTASDVTVVVATAVKSDRQISERRLALMLGKETGVFIELDLDRPTDDWYSVTVRIGPNEKRYGPLYFVSMCPQAPTAQSQPQPARPAAVVGPAAEALAERPQGWLHRLLG